MAPDAHPLAQHERVAFADLADHELLLEPEGTSFRDELDAEATAAGFTLRPRAEVDGLRLIATLAFQGFGAAVVPATAAPRWLEGPWVRVAVEGLGRRSVGLARRRRGLLSAPARALWTTVLDVIESEGDSLRGDPPARHVTAAGRGGSQPPHASPSPSLPTTPARCPPPSPRSPDARSCWWRSAGDRRRGAITAADGHTFAAAAEHALAAGLPAPRGDLLQRRRRARRGGRAARLGHSGPGAGPLLRTGSGAAGRYRAGGVGTRAPPGPGRSGGHDRGRLRLRERAPDGGDLHR